MKSKEEIKQEIYKLAKNISETNSEDILLESARELHEKSVLLKHMSDLPPSVPENELKKEEPVKPDPPKKETFSKESAIDLFSSEPAPAEISPEPVPEKIIIKESKVSRKKTDDSVGEKLQHKKIVNLKASIGINEKFQFINELFEGNMKEYNVAIDQINSFSSHTEAESYIANLQEVYKWKEDNFITLNFLELVQRRFS